VLFYLKTIANSRRRKKTEDSLPENRHGFEVSLVAQRNGGTPEFPVTRHSSLVTYHSPARAAVAEWAAALG